MLYQRKEKAYFIHNTPHSILKGCKKRVILKTIWSDLANILNSPHSKNFTFHVKSKNITIHSPSISISRYSFDIFKK